MDSLHRSKHLWCLKRCKEASIDRSKTLGCLMLASCAQLSFYLTFGEIEAKPSISPSLLALLPLRGK
jgi:hypothetical protein